MPNGDSSVSPNGALGPTISTIVAGAGHGDLECQRYLFQDRIDALSNPDTLIPDAMLIAMEAVLFGRLIASHGQPADARRLAGALCHASVVFRSGGRRDLGDFLMAETISVLEQLAEQGDDVAAISSHILIDEAPVELFDHVRTLRRQSTQEEKA